MLIWIAVAGLFMLGGFLLMVLDPQRDDLSVCALAGWVCTLVSSIIFGFCLLTLACNRWKQEIPSGIYVVEFVHQSGPNVSIGVQEKGEKGELRLVPYQFPAAAFASPIRKDATKLVVVEGQGFKILRLE
jgi:hypothetical protein